MTRYFSLFRTLASQSTDREKSLDKYGVVHAFRHGIQGRALPFRTVAERFHLIDDASKTVYIPLDEGEALSQRLLSGERSRKLFRSLGQYGVSVCETQFQTLLRSGSLTPLDEDSAILADTGRYSAETGLCLQDDMSFLCV